MRHAEKRQATKPYVRMRKYIMRSKYSRRAYCNYLSGARAFYCQDCGARMTAPNMIISWHDNATPSHESEIRCEACMVALGKRWAECGAPIEVVRALGYYR